MVTNRKSIASITWSVRKPNLCSHQEEESGQIVTTYWSKLLLTITWWNKNRKVIYHAVYTRKARVKRGHITAEIWQKGLFDILYCKAIYYYILAVQDINNQNTVKRYCEEALMNLSLFYTQVSNVIKVCRIKGKTILIVVILLPSIVF